jgi:hypothetical protein
MGSSLNGTGVTFNDGTSQSTAAGTTVDVQTFNSTATWTKPTGGQTMARVQVWGGGGGGGRSATASGAAGGGGGAYNELTVLLSYLASSFTVTVATGGAGATTSGFGATGGFSSVPLSTSVNGRSTITAYGGSGGSNGGSGGGGGGQLSAAVNGNTPGNPNLTDFIYGNFVPSAQGTGGFWSGGGGGAGGGGPAGQSMFGGGGGTASNGPASISLWGGAGGVGAVGTVPSGGGGMSNSANVNGFAGAAGRVIITCW